MKPIIHPKWRVPIANMVDGYSLEMTTRDRDSLRAAAQSMRPGTPVAVPFLPDEAFADRIAAARLVRELGFEPMPHFSARRIRSDAEFEDYLTAVVAAAQVKRCFVIAGDAGEPDGPFEDSSALIENGAFERAGIAAIGIGGHPEGHPIMSDDRCWAVLADKCAQIERRGMATLIVTQFAFDADRVLAWLSELRARGIDAPVRLGVPGPAGIVTLLQFAARCGVAASASVLAKYGISIVRLMGSAGPDRLVETLEARLVAEHGPVRLHFYPFGGLERTVEWIAQYDRAHPQR